MKKILITGGAGFIGFHLGKKFIDKGYKVDLVDNFKRGIIDFDLKKLLLNKNMNLIKQNLLKIDLKKFNRDYDKIFHLAAIIGVKHVNRSPYKVLIDNINLLDNLIKIAQRQKKLSKFVFFSTSEVYSGTLKYYGLKIPTPENTPLTVNDLNIGRTSYMLSKIYGEMMCNLSNDLPHINIRPHNFYGPRMGFSHVIPELIKKIYFTKKEKIKIASPNHRRTFCYIDDAVDLIYKLSESKKTTSKTYNIGSDQNNIKIIDLAKKISNLIGKKVYFLNAKNEIGSPSKRCPSLKNLKKVIKVDFKNNLNQGLNETLEWYKKNIFINNKKTFI